VPAVAGASPAGSRRHSRRLCPEAPAPTGGTPSRHKLLGENPEEVADKMNATRRFRRLARLRHRVGHRTRGSATDWNSLADNRSGTECRIAWVGRSPPEPVALGRARREHLVLRDQKGRAGPYQCMTAQRRRHRPDRDLLRRGRHRHRSGVLPGGRTDRVHQGELRGVGCRPGAIPVARISAMARSGSSRR
jgi:hypothetical protein